MVGMHLEMVPEPTKSWSLKSELGAKQWTLLNQVVCQRASNRCEECLCSSQIECLEQWEYNDTTHTQTLVGFKALCPACREVRDLGRACSRGDGKRVASHLQALNRWSPEELDAQIEKAFDVWMERSAHDWTLDLRLLVVVQTDPEIIGRSYWMPFQLGQPAN